MICKWAYGLHVFEFDAINKKEEIAFVRLFAAAHGWKFSEMKRVNEE